MDMRLAADASGSEDQPWALPEGWCWAAIGDIARLRGEKVNPSDAPQLPFVGMDDIPNDGLRVLNTKPFAQMKSAGNKFEPGDVLYGRLRPYLNKTAIASAEGAASGELLAIKTEIDANFFQFFLHYRGFINRAMATVSGDRPRIDFSTISEFKFPLAPLPEQRRIVERIESLFAEIAEGEAALEDARKGLETFRRALLKAAVTGELTRDWRENNQPNETGHDLLARIKAERDATPKSGRGKKAAASPPLDTSDLPELPEGWAWATLEDVKASNQRNGISIAGSSSPPGVKAMRLDALTASGLNLDAVRYIPLKEDRIEDYKVNRGDFLVSRANGSAELVGRAILVEEVNEVVVFPDTMIRYPLGKDQRVGRWIEAAWSSPFGRRQIRRLAKTTAGILKISQEDIAQIFLPMPPLAEVDEILRRATAALIINTDTLEFLKDRAADATRLRQAILKSAFEGTLVPQDPSDEPASVMLERLKQSLQTAQAGRRGRKKARHGG